MVRMQGGNDVDYPGVISTLLSTQQMRRYIGRPAGRRGADRQICLFGDNAI